MNLEHLLPSSCWTHDADSHCLLIELPGFKQQEIRLRADDNGNVIVSGERQENENKIIHFNQSFKVPENSDIEETSAYLEDGIFCITIPKKTPSENKVPETENPNSTQKEERDNVSDDSDTDSSSEEDENNKETEEDEEEFHDSRDYREKEWNERNLMKNLKKRLMENRSIVITAVLAFSLGVIMSQAYQSNIQVERPQNNQ